MKRAYHKIILLFLLLFLLDKLFILAPVYAPEAAQHSNVSWRRLAMEKEAAQSQRRFTVAYFGSSRSERFVNLAGETRLAEYLSETERQTLNSIRYLHLTHIGGLAITYYQSLSRLEQAGLLPDLVLFEVAPEIFEAGHRNFHPRSEMIFSPEYDFKYFFFLVRESDDYEIRKGALARLLFSVFATRPRPDLLFQSPERNLGIPEAATYVRNYTDYLPEQMTGDVRKERVDFFLEMYGNNYRDYRVEPLQEKALEKIIEIVQRNQRKILLWVPYVMPEFQAILDSTSFKEFRSKVSEMALSQNIPFAVLNGPSIRCRQYSDASHYSTRCTPDIMLRLLKASGVLKYAKG